MRFTKKWRAFLLGFFYVLAGAAPVWADDTEIYFGGGSAGEGTRNNILFVIDTSQSMTYKDGDTKSRMDELKPAFKDLIKSLANVNVGLMRFSEPGGPVLYPVTNISQVVPPTGVTSTTVDKSIPATTDDGFQLNTAGTVDLSSERLSLGKTTTGSVPYTFTQRIAVSTDDGYTRISKNETVLNNGTLIRNNITLGETTVGMRFSSVGIPKPTTAAPVIIDEAYLVLTVSDFNSIPPVSMAITGELVSGPTFSNNVSSDNRISVRSAKTSNIASPAVDWKVSGTAMPVKGEQVTTPNLAAMVQKMVDQSTWSTGSGMTFFYKGTAPAETGRLNFYASDTTVAATTAPQLVIKYRIGNATPVTSDVTTALRFTSVDIPQNARITSASLNFTAGHSSSETASFLITGEKLGSAPALTTTNFDFTSRISRTSPVIWNGASAPALGTWEVDKTYSTPDLSAVVQEIVNQSGWCSGNNLALFISGSTGQRWAYSSDENSSLAPTLSVTYDPASISAGNTCIQTSLTSQVSATSDDAEEDAGSAADVTGTKLQLAAGTKKERVVGLRFTNITLPPNTKIQSAYLQFYAVNSTNPAVNLTIAGQKTLDAPTFAARQRDIRDRAKTSASVSWSLSDTDTWTSGTLYTSPDVSAIVQELVNQSDSPGWAAGNDMAFIISGGSNTNFRSVKSRNDSAGVAPKLIINYVHDGSALRTVKDVLLETVDSLKPAGFTPLQDTFYESVQYFRGQAVDYGKRRGRDENGNGRADTRVSHPGSMVPGTFTITPSGCQNSSADSCKNEKISNGAMYKSPINYACQANHVILLTDGEPNEDNSTAKIKALPGFPTGECSYASGGECVPELAEWANKTVDLSDLPGRQSLIVDTIAFYQGTDSTAFLSETATKGGGMSLAASSDDELLKALQKLTVGAISENASFVAAGAAVNAFNRMQNRDDLYFSVFKPQKTPRWPGNLKKYKLDFRDDPSTAEAEEVPLVIDANDKPAVNPKTGFFKDNALSYWSIVEDGPEVTKGGASALMNDYAARKLYTNLGTSKDLAAATNALSTDNTLVTKAAFKAEAYTDDEFTKLVEWTIGKDVKNEDANTATTTRFIMADPLHSRPVAITYKGTESEPDTTIYVATNGGALHAINDADGRELFAFIPSDLLPLQKTHYENVESVQHPYGLDGAITTWVIDPDGDGVVLNADGSVQPGNKAILVIGMGRGGNNYYALDVTDRAHPQLMWTIKGGTTAGFEALGQTWSQPEKVMIKLAGDTSPRRVLIMGGGYDPKQDDTFLRPISDAIGRAIYMVDLMDGTLKWSAGDGPEYNLNLAAMDYSIPAQVTSADFSGDGLIDFFFVGDMGGQVWRFDVKNGASAANLVKGGVIADLGVAGGDNFPQHNRRFYHSPSLFQGKNNGTPYLGVMIGSGWRGHPLNEDTNDMFFMIRQTAIYAPPTAYSKVVLNDLLDITNNIIGEGTAAQKAAAATDLATSKQGWYLRLTNSGEKVLSTPLILGGEASFTTYEPNTSSLADPCTPRTGTNRLYTVMVTDGTPARDRDSNGFTAADRSKELLMPGIAGSSVTFNTADGPSQGAGAELEKIKSLDPGIKRIYWYENRAR